MAWTKEDRKVSPDSSKLVPLGNKLNNRFYEPIVLLVTLNNMWKSQRKPKFLDPPSDVEQAPKPEFQCFVNNIALMCDSEQGGRTVTAFVVLEHPDRIEYRFASNQRSEKDLTNVQEYLEHLLRTLHASNDLNKSKLVSYILRKVICFIRPRIEVYIKSLKENTASCISKCKLEDTAASKSMLRELEKLQDLLCFPTGKAVGDDSFSADCETLIYDIDRLYHSDMNKHMRQRSKEGKINESACWCELRHAATRLDSYLRATRRLVRTRERLPELFENFEVTYIKSSVPAPCPLKPKGQTKGLFMRDIIGRMTSDPTAMEKYRGYAEQLEKIKVDEYIQDTAWDKNFRPYVHAEVLVLDSVLKDGRAYSSRFYGRYQYIGCSKPTCKLCHYYFSNHRSGVEVQETHQNLYHNWRTPDVYDEPGKGPEKDRATLMNKILDRVRQDAFRTLIEKVPEGKPHDSNSEPTYQIDGMSVQVVGERDPLANMMQSLHLGRSGDDSVSVSNMRDSEDAQSDFAAASDCEEEEEEDEEGGVSL